ncbi:hypothetical protein BDF20DRAFT_909316 [Mycotypha africana]|uniref:uncharacterized protein n=1 Tax=Mycotypha africana TaxID=64632 RepID=UPI00230039F8|nr:uncharacterized protein BDF20DRAFT_909316 [Mycotypha africana]KAI8991545.1 hypothetical protein BDF20DRAFT_909316 [Mycotypha africana]
MYKNIIRRSADGVPTSLYRKASGFIRSGYFKISNSLPSITALLLLQMQVCITQCLARFTMDSCQTYCKTAKERQQQEQQPARPVHSLNPFEITKRIVKKCLYWLLSFVVVLVDCIAKFLNVYQEMQEFVNGERVIRHISKDEQDHHNDYHSDSKNIIKEAKNKGPYLNTPLPEEVTMRKKGHSHITISKQQQQYSGPTGLRGSNSQEPQYNQPHHRHRLRHIMTRHNLNIRNEKDNHYYVTNILKDRNEEATTTSINHAASCCAACTGAQKSDNDNPYPEGPPTAPIKYPQSDEAQASVGHVRVGLKNDYAASTSISPLSFPCPCCNKSNNEGLASRDKAETCNFWKYKNGCCCGKKDWLRHLLGLFQKKKIYSTTAYSS